MKPVNDDVLLRSNYKEYLELAKFPLVDKLTRRRKAPRQSNFLVLTAIYTMKLTLLLRQFPNNPWYRKKKLDKMALFFFFVFL